MSSNVSRLNAFAPVLQPMPVSNDSISLCFRPGKGILSRRDKDGFLLSVKHPLSFGRLQYGLRDCPDADLVQFVLDGIQNGM